MCSLTRNMYTALYTYMSTYACNTKPTCCDYTNIPVRAPAVRAAHRPQRCVGHSMRTNH